jgi:hypothetical protein
MFDVASIVATRRTCGGEHGPWVETHGYHHSVATRRGENLGWITYAARRDHGRLAADVSYAEAPGREDPKLPVLCRRGLVRGSDAAENPKPAGYNPMIRSDHRP